MRSSAWQKETRGDDCRSPAGTIRPAARRNSVAFVASCVLSECCGPGRGDVDDGNALGGVAEPLAFGQTVVLRLRCHPLAWRQALVERLEGLKKIAVPRSPWLDSWFVCSDFVLITELGSDVESRSRARSGR
jgi:hypothetical protein